MFFLKQHKLAIQMVIIVALMIFIVETAIMFIIPFLPPMSDWAKNIIDATALVIFIFPVLYRFIFIPYLNELTGHKQAKFEKEKAKAANQAKNVFLTHMSQDLHNPLFTILGANEVLLEKAQQNKNDSDIKQLKEIRNNVKHLLYIINDIMDISKIESGQMELRIEEVAIKKVIQEVLELSAPHAKARDNKLQQHISKGIREIYTDSMKLKQILINLLSNACKFTAHGKIDLSVTSKIVDEKEYILFEVKDTGIGMTKEEMNKISNLTSIEISMKRKEGGTGLGLCLSYQLAQLMHGYIDVKSKKNQGSVFTLALPRQYKS